MRTPDLKASLSASMCQHGAAYDCQHEPAGCAPGRKHRRVHSAADSGGHAAPEAGASAEGTPSGHRASLWQMFSRSAAAGQESDDGAPGGALGWPRLAWHRPIKGMPWLQGMHGRLVMHSAAGGFIDMEAQPEQSVLEGRASAGAGSQ